MDGEGGWDEGQGVIKMNGDRVIRVKEDIVAVITKRQPFFCNFGLQNVLSTKKSHQKKNLRRCLLVMTPTIVACTPWRAVYDKLQITHQQ